MRDIEKQLERRALAPPDERLDRRMDQLFAGYRPHRPLLLLRGVPLWACLAVCTLFAFGGFWLRGALATPQSGPARTQTTVYIIESGAPLPREAFDATARRDRFLFRPDEIEMQVIPSEATDADSKENAI